MRLRVLSLNVWGLPSPVGRHVHERLALVLRELPRHACELALFQEVWTEPAREQLTRGGRALGFEHSWSQGPARGGGGLLVLSTRPIEAAAFRRYTLGGLPQRLTQMDYYSGKGVARLDLAIAGTEIAVFLTHLQARYSPASVPDEYVGHRTGQVIELAEEVRAVSSPVLAVGDFNMRDSSPEYAAMMQLTGFVDAAVRLDVRAPTVTLDNVYRLERKAISESRIDYVFCRSGTRVGVRPLSLARVYQEPVEVAGSPGAYSDHTGLLVEVELGGPGEAFPVVQPETLARCRALLGEGRARARVRRDQQRLGVLACAAGSAGAIGAARRTSLSRRRFLRNASFGFAGVAAGSGVSLAALAERFVPDELADYATVEATLSRLAEGSGPTEAAPAGVDGSLR
jgi:endonuclease/exonuclease/phosphatase family metal-dependent hydrolase